MDHISRDVQQVASTQRELQQQIHRLAAAQETSTNELKYLINQGFEQLTQGIAENKQLILREYANVISAHQRVIHELKEVTTDFPCCLGTYSSLKILRTHLISIFVSSFLCHPHCFFCVISFILVDLIFYFFRRLSGQENHVGI